MNDELEAVLKEVALLKAKREAVDGLLSERYKVIEKRLRDDKLTKYSIGEGKANVTARIKNRSKMELLSLEKLLESVADPMQFARLVLDTVSFPKKLVQAMKDIGVDVSIFRKVPGTSYLEVTVGKEDESRHAIREAEKVYVRDVEDLRKALSESVLSEAASLFLRKPVLPQEIEEERDAD